VGAAFSRDYGFVVRAYFSWLTRSAPAVLTLVVAGALAPRGYQNILPRRLLKGITGRSNVQLATGEQAFVRLRRIE